MVKKWPSERTWLHRIMRKDAGEIPDWLLSSGCSIDFAAISVVTIGLATSIIALAVIRYFETSNVPWWLGICIALITLLSVQIALSLAIEQVRTVERKARAISRCENKLGKRN
jgi:hypothetical protein